LHVAPAPVAIAWLEQNVSDWLPLVNVQHLSYVGSLQSDVCSQSCTVSVPLQFETNAVAHCAAHVDEMDDVVQFGAVPPFKTTVPQQIGVALFPHTAGLVHVSPASPPPSPFASLETSLTTSDAASFVRTTSTPLASMPMHAHSVGPPHRRRKRAGTIGRIRMSFLMRRA
jgi:hypothetical protein